MFGKKQMMVKKSLHFVEKVFTVTVYTLADVKKIVRYILCIKPISNYF